MNGDMRPLFTKGRVVKKESLDQLEQFPREMARIFLEGYSDGILSGFDLTVQEQTLFISAGAVKYHGEVLLFREAERSFTEYGNVVIVKLCLGEMQRTEDFCVVPAEWKVDGEPPQPEREMELGRFCLSEGAVLRRKYQGVEDFKTAYNTLDFTHVLYAGEGRAAMSPRLMKQFGEELFSLESGHPLDDPFALLCMNHAVVQRVCVERYLSRRLGEKSREYTNEEIYSRMLQVLRSGSSGERSGRRMERKGPCVM